MEPSVRKLALRLAFVACMPFFASCSASPTEAEINQSLENQLRTVAGPWTGIQPTQGVTGLNTISLEFSLAEQPNGAVGGAGTMKEANAANAVSMTVTGSFIRPTLDLTFSGMVYEGQSVTGTFRGSYLTVAGIADSLRLTAPGYYKAIPLLLQKR